jgi:hypothetical protein
VSETFEIELHVKQDEVYELLWTVPDVPVTNVFIDPDGDEQAFADPDPTPAGKSASRIEIRAQYGLREQFLKPDPFRKNRTPPEVEHVTDPIEGMKLKHFRARFMARRPGVQRFEVRGGPQNIAWLRTMQIERVPRQYNTIEEVANDVAAVRRHAILADICDFFPAFNTSSVAGGADPNLKVKTPSGIPGQGDWKATYDFNATLPDTSCTTINPRMMGGKASNDSTKWAFNAGPHHKEGKNKAWVDATAQKLPSVADTYIVLNGYTYHYGHVGIILHRPPDGNGLWVTADGGQGGKPQQLALIVPRWGVMGAHLPKRGEVPGAPGQKYPYPKMKPEPNGAVFLSGAGKIDIRHEEPELVPPAAGDPQAVVEWLKYRETYRAAEVSNPRRLHGYVDVDDLDNLNFKVDEVGYKQENVDKCHELAQKVQKVIEVGLAGKTLVAGT